LVWPASKHKKYKLLNNTMDKNLIRFIAGAVCPSCKEQDKIALSADDQEIYCISCGFKETRPQDPSKPKKIKH